MRQLRTIEDLTRAHEDLYDRQERGKMDAKTAEALNTTLKGVVYLQGKLRLDYAKLYILAQVKKIDLPSNLLPMLEKKQ